METARVLLQHGLAAVLLASAPWLAHAQQGFPVRPVRVVNSSTAGGQPDTIARWLAQKMSEA